MIIPALGDLASICSQHGITEAILSPGSRCAPISLALIRHPSIHCRTISDERSAAFIALGIAQQLNMPTLLVCTSGSAAYNYAPAVAEAFYQQVPLIVITADRPPEWIDQWDGQTIQQTEIYGSHVKKSFSFPDSFSHADNYWLAHRTVNEAINLALQFPPGPVHINIPLREPFYPAPNETYDFEREIKVTKEFTAESTLSAEALVRLEEEIAKFNKVLILPGQQRPDEQIRAVMDRIHLKKAVVVADLISNQQGNMRINHPDFVLQFSELLRSTQPELIITFGKSLLSKPLKNYVRDLKTAHWHIQPEGYCPDPFQKLTYVLRATPLRILQWLETASPPIDSQFAVKWEEAESRVRQRLPAVITDAPFGELKAIAKCISHLPSHSKLHLANSMAVRYVSMLGVDNSSVEIIANRGTSGIDGSNSTAVGCTFTTKEIVTLITGDMAFLYDRNAFWHNYSMPNLRIIVLNNHAGGIFRMIDGPRNLPELEEYFETKQALTAKASAIEFGFEYFGVFEEQELDQALTTFFKPAVKPKVIEVFSDSASNVRILSEIKSNLV